MVEVAKSVGVGDYDYDDDYEYEFDYDYSTCGYVCPDLLAVDAHTTFIWGHEPRLYLTDEVPSA